MILLASTSDIIRVVTGGAVSSVLVHASWLDNSAGVITAGRTNTAAITTATTTTVVAAPASSVYRALMGLNIGNSSGSSVDVTVEHFDGTNAVSLMKVSLLTGESLVLDATGRWIHYNANGKENERAGAIATRAQMEAATSTDTFVTPGRQIYHPGTAKVWATVGISTATLFDCYNVASITDTAAGRSTITIATDFSSANWCCLVFIQRTITTLTVTNIKHAAIRNASQAAGSVQLECWDGTATTAVQEDPARYYMVGFGTLV